MRHVLQFALFVLPALVAGPSSGNLHVSDTVQPHVAELAVLLGPCGLPSGRDPLGLSIDVPIEKFTRWPYAQCIHGVDSSNVVVPAVSGAAEISYPRVGAAPGVSRLVQPALLAIGRRVLGSHGN